MKKILFWLLFLVSFSYSATTFYATIDTTGNTTPGYTGLALWEASINCDLTLGTSVYSHSGITGSLKDGVKMYGETSGATGTLRHATTSQILLSGTTGVFQSSEVVFATVSVNYVTISDAGDGAIAYAVCVGTTADTTAVTIAGWTPDADNYIEIAGDDTTGIYNTAKYKLSGITGIANNSAVIHIYYTSYIKIHNIQITNWNGATEYQYTYGIRIEGGTNNSIYNNIIFSPESSTYYYKGGIVVDSNSNSNHKIYNNIVYNFLNYRNYGIMAITNDNTFVYNNTVYKIGNGSGGSSIGICYNLNYGTAKNNIGILISGATSGVFSFGANMVANDFNASSDATATGDNSINTVTTADFVSVTSGSENLHLSSTAVEIGIGTDLSLIFTTDIDGETITGNWCIGADWTLPTTVSTPTALGVVSVSSYTVNLGWTDESSNEEGFKIERKTDGTSYIQIDSVTANVESYTDDSIAASTTYYYKIKAFSGALESGYTDEVSTITIQSPIAGFPDLAAGEWLITGQKADGVFSSTDTLNVSFKGSNQSDYNLTLTTVDEISRASDSKINVEYETFQESLSGLKSGKYKVSVSGNGIDKMKRIIIIE